ncbi:L-idonate 5-dehydrogenase [Falsiroseomonas sp. HW251]|uniref:L-idonate 5-dehydrogenase n=1 Tax=Falsiroseomonas sp. HW251 TaxID=3390998 RepID=UPI003D31D383
MKTVVVHAPKDLRIEQAEIPPVGPHDVKVRLRAGGICGSDLHYYQHGGFGTIRLREPLILGHEVAGEIVETGAEVTRVTVGDRVAVNPSRACGRCRFCLAGQPQHCLDMRFYGSAMRMPHVQGAFREVLVCEEAQALPVPPDLPFEHAAFAEPLAVCLHATRQAGQVAGARVLVTGMGPIGMLAMLAARHAGAREVVVTDVVDPPLALARRLGADLGLNTRSDPQALDRFGTDKGHFDVVFEASGAGAALAGALHAARPGATIVQLGLGGEIPLPVNVLVAKEIALRGTFRFHEEFAWAVEIIAARRIDVTPLLTEVLKLDDAVAAFELAGDRGRSMKVQLAL